MSTQRIYVTADGKRVRAESATDLIQWFRQGAFDEAKTMQDYMVAMSERCLFMNHAVIRIDSPENFVADLHKAGIIVNSFPAD